MSHRRAASVPPDAMTIARARALLGEEAETMTDGDVRSACEHATTLARIIVEMFQDTNTVERPM